MKTAATEIATLKVLSAVTATKMSIAVKKVAVLGSGIMGHGIAQISAMAGYQVSLRDIEQSLLDKAMEKIIWSLGKLVEKQKISKQESDSIISRISATVDLRNAIAGADLLIEAVPEDMNLKKKVYAEVENVADKRTIFASNTSTLPITEMAALTSRPANFIGVHFFNPPQLMPLVEVIPGAETEQPTVDLAMGFVQTLGKQAILCRKDVAGFIVNRIFIPLVHEAAYCLDRDGTSLQEIDSAVKFKMAFPMGIFELADYTGLDVVHKATVEMHSRDPKVIRPHPRIRELFEEKKLGQKSGAGFYQYGGENYSRVNLTEDLAKRYDPIALVAVAANNAAWLISNSVCSKEELEKALKLGMGLKTDLFSTVEQFAPKKVVQTLRELSSQNGSFYEPDPFLQKMA